MELQFRTLAAAVAMAVTSASASAASRALVNGDQKPGGAVECKSVADVFGFPANALPEGVIRFNLPRKDLLGTVGGTAIKPRLALGGRAAFHGVGKTDPMALGDLVLPEEGRDTLPSMGVDTSINVLPTGDVQAALAGEFALMGSAR